MAISVREDPYLKLAEIELPDNLPSPQGWRLLIVPYVPPKKSEGGVLLPDMSHEVNQDAVMTGLVLDMGLDAYTGETRSGKPRFSKPWCQIGDWVMFAKWAGSRIQIGQTKFRLLNDDEVFAVVEDPGSVMRA